AAEMVLGERSGGMPLTSTPPQSISSRRIFDLTRGGKKARNPGVNTTVKLRLERGVVRMRIGWKRPQPFSPRVQVVAESLTRLPFKESGQSPPGVCAN